MKRILCIGLLITTLLSLSGCSFHNDDHVQFFYRRGDFLYQQSNGVIDSESRDVSGHTDDLSYLLALYFAGPLDEQLISPFPVHTQLLSVNRSGTAISIDLASPADAFSEADFSLACACLTLTCLELTDAESVTINCAENTITMTRDIILLYDSSETSEPSQGG